VLFDKQGAPFQVAFTLMNEAIALALLKRPDDAVIPARQALAIERELTNNFQVLEALSLAAWFEHDAGNLTEALELHEQAITGLAPHYDKLRSEMISWHISDFMTRFERWEDAARLDGFHLANLSRPEPEIYTNHFAPGKQAYLDALGDRADTLVEEGKAMSGQQVHDYALRALRELRTMLDSRN
jgi:tetratricopeptide (TPR) repeat protein